MSARVTKVALGSKNDADMAINKKKTKTLLVEEQEKVVVSTKEEMLKTEATYKNVCKFCPRRFNTERGKKIHMTSLNCQHSLTDKSFEINDIKTMAHVLVHAQLIASKLKVDVENMSLVFSL